MAELHFVNTIKEQCLKKKMQQKEKRMKEKQQNMKSRRGRYINKSEAKAYHT